MQGRPHVTTAEGDRGGSAHRLKINLTEGGRGHHTVFSDQTSTESDSSEHFTVTRQGQDVFSININ